MDAEYMEPEHDIGPCDYRPGLSGAADASNDTLPQPPVPHTPWYRVVDARRRRVVAEESSKKPPAPFDSRERRQGPGRPRLPRLPEGDHKVVLRIRGGISLQQEAVLPLRAAIQTALRAPLPLEARIRVRKEQNIALVSTPDPDLAEQLCHIQTLLLGSKSYQVSAYVASPDNSCKGVITGALPIPTEDALINETVTYPHAINIIQARPFGKNGACLYTFEGRRVPRYVYFQGVEFRCRPFRPVTQVCHCCLRTGHRHDICPYPQERRCGNCGVLNPDEQHERCLPRCLTCGSDDHPTIDLGCPARQRGLGPRVVKEGRQDPKGHNTTPPRRDTKVSTTNQQPGDIPKNTCSQGPQSTAQYKEPKISYHEKKTKQPVQPRVPPTIRTPATPLSNHPPFAPAQCGARSEVTWPALPQREPTQAPGSAARGGPTSSSSSATGGSRDPDPQLQQRQDPLADASKSPVEQASPVPPHSAPPHAPVLLQQTCAQYFQTPEFTQGLTQLVLKFVSDSLEAVKTQLVKEQEQAQQRMETMFIERIDKIETAINHLYDLHAQSSPTRKHKQPKSAAAARSPQPTEEVTSPQSGISTPITPQHGQFQ